MAKVKKEIVTEEAFEAAVEYLDGDNNLQAYLGDKAQKLIGAITTYAETGTGFDEFVAAAKSLKNLLKGMSGDIIAKVDAIAAYAKQEEAKKAEVGTEEVAVEPVAEEPTAEAPVEETAAADPMHFVGPEVKKENHVNTKRGAFVALVTALVVAMILSIVGAVLTEKQFKKYQRKLDEANKSVAAHQLSAKEAEELGIKAKEEADAAKKAQEQAESDAAAEKAAREKAEKDAADAAAAAKQAEDDADAARKALDDLRAQGNGTGVGTDRTGGGSMQNGWVEQVENPDGSTTTVTHTVDENGNETVSSTTTMTVYDEDGNPVSIVLNDEVGGDEDASAAQSAGEQDASSTFGGRGR